jgi:hypothetical protein
LWLVLQEFIVIKGSKEWVQVRGVDSRLVHPTGQKSKKCPQVEGLPVLLSNRHAKIRRDGYRRRAPPEFDP